MTMLTQSPGAPVTPGEAAVACAIWCCDQKEYPLQNNRGGRKTCQRLGNRKHSCVLHSLRKKNGDKLTTENKRTDVQASPRIQPGTRGNNTGRVLIPDTIVDGNKVIDAKFPCQDAAVKFSKGKLGTVQNLSDGRLGTQMGTPKEAIEYKKIDGGMKTECMTPADAKDKKGDNCDCKDISGGDEEEDEEE
jgi:hypothetical protein